MRFLGNLTISAKILLLPALTVLGILPTIGLSMSADPVTLGAIAGIVLAVGTFAAWLIGRDITKGLDALKDSMARLGAGDLSAKVPGLERRDEVGSIARALLVFRGHAREARATKGRRRIASNRL
jgi:HAMP domain-containing protein